MGFTDIIKNKLGFIDKDALFKTLLNDTLDVSEAIVSVIDCTGIAGFKFHVPIGESVKFESDITDYYVDNNTAVQDHIAQKPVRITLSGLQGEYFYSLHELEDTIATIRPTLNLLQTFLPQISTYAQKQKQNLLNWGKEKLKNVAKSIIGIKDDSYTKYDLEEPFHLTTSSYKYDFSLVELFSLVQNIYKLKSKQTQAFYYFEALWKSRAWFSIETSWKRFDRMAIESIQAIRDNNADITDFRVTFKQMNVAYIGTYSKAEMKVQQALSNVLNKGVDSGLGVVGNILSRFPIGSKVVTGTIIGGD